MLPMQLQQCVTDLAQNLTRAPSVIHKSGLAPIAAVYPA